jgi:hypothetical protein
MQITEIKLEKLIGCVWLYIQILPFAIILFEEDI